MAVWALLASAPLSTPGTAWKRVESQMLSFVGSNSGGNYDILTTPRSIAVTFANAGNQQGIFLQLYSTTTSLVIKLQENVAGTWTDRTTDNFSPSVVASRFQIHYFSLTPYAVTAAASTWRYVVSAASGYLCRSTVAGEYFHAAVLDASAVGPTTGDTVLVADGQTLTFDQTFTFGATNTAAMVLAEGSALQWENPPIAAYTMTLGGWILNSYTTTIAVGSEASPIPVAQRASIVHAGNTAFLEYGWGPSGQRYKQGGTFEIWGAEDTHFHSRIAATASSGQKTFVTEDDMSAHWSSGDKVTFFGLAYNGWEATEYTIDTVIGTSVTLTTNLAYSALQGGAVANYTRAYNTLGVYFASAGVAYLFSDKTALDNIKLVGTCFNTARPGVAYYLYNTVAPTIMRSILCKTQLAQLGCSALIPGYVYETIVQDVVLWNTSSGSGYTILTFGGASSAFGGLTLRRVYVKGAPNGLVGTVVNASKSVIDGLVSTHHSGNAAQLLGGGNEITDCMFGGTSTSYGGATKAALHCQTVFSHYDGVRIYGSGYGLLLQGAVDNRFDNCYPGSQIAASIADIYYYTDSPSTCVFDDCYLGTAGIGNIAMATDGSYAKFNKYGAAVGDHRTFLVYGNLRSVGDGLTDTTVHTSGSGKFALRFEPTSAANNLEWEFTVPTGDITAKTMTIACWVKINSATYYAGTHEKPRLTVRYDNATDAYAEAVAGTGWQLLSVTFTPTTSYGQVTVTVSGRTDATGTDRYFYADDMAVLYPAGYKLDLGGLDLWADALPITPPIATVLSANDVWTAAVSTLTGAGTVGKLVADNVDAAISTRLAAASYTVSPSAATIADAVFDEAMDGHAGWLTKLLSLGKYLSLK